MQLSLDNHGWYTIRAYGPEGVTIALPPGERAENPVIEEENGFRNERLDVIPGSFLVASPGHLDRNWSPQSFEELERGHFETLAELNVEVLLLGTGDRIRFPHPQVTAPVNEAGIGLECLDTPGACRTFNVIAAEGRPVAAAILATSGAT